MSETGERTVALKEAFDALIRSSHRTLLGREVDDQWHGPFLQELMKRSQSQSLDEVTTFFLQLVYNSPEGQNRAALVTRDRAFEFLTARGGPVRPAPLQCLSAGPSAYTAMLLKRAGLRKWAGPFDWMTIPAGAVLDCIADDCTSLLNPAQYEPIPVRDRPEGSLGHLCLHKKLSERHGPTIFHRVDPATPEGFAYLERCVLRFRDALRGLHGKMLVQVLEEDDQTAEVFAETGEVLDRVARGAHLVTVAKLEGAPAGPFPEIELSEVRGAHRLLRCRTLSRMTGLAHEDQLDDVVIFRGLLAAPELEQPTG
jgi:hypothetical protein